MRRIPLGLVALIALTAVARATPVAVPPATSPPRPFAHPHAGLGGGLAIGTQRQDGVDGWVARLDYEGFPVLAPRGTFGGLFGFVPALQLWRAGEDWGVGVPVAIALGVRAPGIRAMALVGFEAMLVDVVADDTGFGLYAPLAGARVAVDVGGWYAGADARVERRWQIGAPDHTQWQASIVFGHTWETKPKAPMR
ncbi:MAG: hypothetical protein JNK64_14855 [Myxococcales bacterium]|nr:hypothetical protein [Myxococcales bacterium]